MSVDPLSDPLLKMEALMKKHRGPAERKPDTPPEGWLPVLTEVIHRGERPAPPLLSEPAPAPVMPQLEATPQTAAHVTDTLAEQLLSELAPKLSEVMEKQVASELRKNLDETVATLLSQLDVNVREIVRDAVAEKLKLRQPDS